MILQNSVMPEKMEYRDLYYRASNTICQKKGYLLIPTGEKLSSDTYMNSFDIEAWKRYTDISNLFLCIKYEGKGKITLICERKDGIIQKIIEENIMLEKQEKGVVTQYRIKIADELKKGIIYYEILSEEDMKLYQVSYETEMPIRQESRLALVICTYKRKKYLENIIDILNSGEGFAKKNCWLDVIVVDNASELTDEYGANIHVYHNRNTGGSGGFSRGMDEVVNRLKCFPATHVVLMDDDVLLEYESLIRLHAILSYMKEEYLSEAVAGRMFRLDKPTIQYTAVEIWNGGDIKHIGWNQDMALKSSVWNMNNNTGGEYGGWWFECYPIGFVKKNRPLPFFIHCDDVEYGLRHGGTPIILNGIQVWHETFEYRQSAIIAYYDMRNRLFVNELYEINRSKEKLLSEWKKEISLMHAKKDYKSEYMMIYGLWDYLKGLQWLLHIDLEKKHFGICIKRANRWKNAFFWRLTSVVFWIKNSGRKKEM